MNFSDMAYFQLSTTNVNNKFSFTTKDLRFVCNFEFFEIIKYLIFKVHSKIPKKQYFCQFKLKKKKKKEKKKCPDLRSIFCCLHLFHSEYYCDNWAPNTVMLSVIPNVICYRIYNLQRLSCKMNTETYF